MISRKAVTQLVSLAFAASLSLVATDSKAAIILDSTSKVSWAFKGSGNFDAVDVQNYLNTGALPQNGNWSFQFSNPAGASYDLDGDSLSSAYKANNAANAVVDGEGDYASSYDTAYSGPTGTDGHTLASLTYTGGQTIQQEHMFLIAKDGNSDPNVYVFDLNSGDIAWNGIEEIQIGNLTTGVPLFNSNSISHIEIVTGGGPLAVTVVPEPATLAIWSVLGGIGLISGRRRTRRKAVS